MSRVKYGVNDLETFCKQNDREDLLQEWDYEKNGELTPRGITAKNMKKVWWKDSFGHSWDTSVYTRTGETRSGCPFCCKFPQRILSGFNDFETYCKKNNKIELLEEWDYEKNVDYTPANIAYGSDKKVWWKCGKGHSWFVSPNHRTSKGGKGCPFCANRKVLPGYNDLSTIRPDIATEWDYGRNTVSPDMVLVHSNTSYYWLCSKGHSYKAKVNDRTKNNGTACPICANQRVLSGYNDVSTLIA